MKRRNDIFISSLYCQVCNFELTIPRSDGNKRKHHHKKDMFCPNCNKVQKFIEE